MFNGLLTGEPLYLHKMAHTQKFEVCRQAGDVKIKKSQVPPCCVLLTKASAPAPAKAEGRRPLTLVNKNQQGGN